VVGYYVALSFGTREKSSYTHTHTHTQARASRGEKSKASLRRVLRSFRRGQQPVKNMAHLPNINRRCIYVVRGARVLPIWPSYKCAFFEIARRRVYLYIYTRELFLTFMRIVAAGYTRTTRRPTRKTDFLIRSREFLRTRSTEKTVPPPRSTPPLVEYARNMCVPLPS